MRELLEKTLARLRAGEGAVWCVILAAAGSTPRGPGAKMAVFEDGTSVGTVGGGAVEHQAMEFARTMDGKSALVRDYELHSGGEAGLGMVCGGRVRIGFLPLRPTDEPLLGDLLLRFDETERGGSPWLLKLYFRGEGSSICAEAAEPIGLHGAEDAPLPFPSLTEADGGLVYAEPVRPRARVVIFGAGHVSRALVPVLLPLNFSVTVLDPRTELTDPGRFPGAALRRAEFDPLPPSLRIGPRDYLVVMTPGHEKDLAVLRQVLRSPAAYIGCIGSRKKTAYVNQKLLEGGFTESELRRIHAPIGLPIQARTPEEIAVSIAAELIQHRAALAGPPPGDKPPLAL